MALRQWRLQTHGAAAPPSDPVQLINLTDRVLPRLTASEVFTVNTLYCAQAGCRSQSGGSDLGERIRSAFAETLGMSREAGSRGAIIIGTDAPDLRAAHLEAAAVSLRKHEVRRSIRDPTVQRVPALMLLRHLCACSVPKRRSASRLCCDRRSLDRRGTEVSGCSVSKRPHRHHSLR